VEKDCKARGLNREDAMDRSRWRKQIGMIDDHNKCEWVNVSSGSGSPGFPGQNPKSRKTVVCVFVQHPRQNLLYFFTCFLAPMSTIQSGVL